MTKEALRNQSSTDDPAGKGRYAADLVEFVQEASIGVAVLDRAGRVLWANRAVYESLGFARDDFFGGHCREWFASPEEAERLIDRLFAGEVMANVRVTLRHRAGETRSVALDGDASWHEDMGRARLLIRDVTRELEAGREVRLQTRMLDAVGQAVIATQPDGRITYWNRAAEEMYGWSAEEAAGQSVFELVVPPDDVNGREIFESLLAGRS